SITDASGQWEFPILPPGVYSIVETQPPGFPDGSEQDGDPNGPPVTIGNDRFDNVQLSPFNVRGPFNFGELPVDNSSLAGAVYVDFNANGVRDPGEMGIPGVVVTLTGVDLTGLSISVSVVTDSNGDYIFSNMAPGTYRLTETQPEMFIDGADRA